MAHKRKWKRPVDHDQDRLVFAVLRACRHVRTNDLAHAAGVAHSTVSKLRTRFTRYVRLETAAKLLKAVGASLAIVNPEGDIVYVDKPTRQQRRHREERAHLH